jgi:hypothetical protein
MTPSLDLKYSIRDALRDFDKKPLVEGAIGLFKTLGYESQRRFELIPNNVDQFLGEFDQENKFNKDKALTA